MLIKDVQRFISIMMNESMGKKQFKNAIRGKDYNPKEMEMALSVWSSEDEIKKNYILNDYVDNPQKLIDEILENPKIKFYSEIKYLKDLKSKLEKEDYCVVKDDKNFIFLAIGNWQTNGYFARHYLRQRKDGVEFGSGPTWCIADGKEGGNMWDVYNLDDGHYPNTYMLLSKSNSLIRYQFTFEPDKLEEFMDGDVINEIEEWDDEIEEYVIQEETRQIEDTIKEVRDIFQEKAEEDNSVFKDIYSNLKISLSDIGDWLLEKKNTLYSFKNDSHGEKSKIREELEKVYKEIEKKKRDYIEDYVTDELKEKFNLSDKKYDKSEMEDALYVSSSVYFNNKNINTSILKFIFDLYYYTATGDESALMDVIIKSNINFKDFVNITKELEEHDKSFRMSHEYYNLFFIYLFFKHQDKPIPSDYFMTNKITLIQSVDFVKEIIKRCEEYRIQRCLSGDIFKAFTANGDILDEIKNNYPNKYFTKETLSNEECYILNLIRRYWQNIKKEPNIMLRLLFAYADYHYSDEEDMSFDDCEYFKNHFIYNNPKFETMILQFIEVNSEKYFKKFVSAKDLKDYLCLILDKQVKRSKDAIWSLWRCIKKYKSIGFLTDEEFKSYEEKYQKWSVENQTQYSSIATNS